MSEAATETIAEDDWAAAMAEQAAARRICQLRSLSGAIRNKHAKRRHARYRLHSGHPGPADG